MNQFSAKKKRILALKYPCQGGHKNLYEPPTRPLRDVFNAVCMVPSDGLKDVLNTEPCCLGNVKL